ncbi:hypothetical protein LBMAG42_30960 [Deltaproteobacteria bacterium]|nr:hypothetical protein LBMAG42_30960 [Deltaproteobacteria bacterium]
MPPVAPSEPALAPERIGPYRLLRPISAGGMARVYEGRFDSLAGVSTRVAIKVIHPDFANEGGFQELFIQEARISARLEHLNVVRVQQFNREGDLYYLVMEYIDGVTFRKIVTACRKHGLRVPPGLLAELGRQACEGLHYAHMLADEHGNPLRLVHRDMKPSNLMLNVQGVVKVLDFGISYAHGHQESRGSVKGTWGYMAPEQAEGEAVGAAADLFGLASVLYEVATLEPLFVETDNTRIRRALASDEAARRAAGLGGAYADVGSVLVRALQRDPAARFRTGEAMGKALGQLVADPMSARDELVRFVDELRARDRAGAAPQADKAASSASVSTMRPQGPGGLPIVTGNMHAPARPARPAGAQKRRSSTFAAVFSVAFAFFSVGVLGFTAWRIFTPSKPSLAVASPAGSGSMSPPDASVAPPPVPSATPTSAPAVATPGPSVPVVKVSVAGEEPPAPPARPASTPKPAAPRGTAPPVATVPVATETLVKSLTVEDASAKTAEGLLSISATPRAQVMVDGAYVRFTPLFQHSVPAGPHTVLLVTEDGRRKTFRLEVPAGAEVRRIWLFDESRWSDQEGPSP